MRRRVSSTSVWYSYTQRVCVTFLRMPRWSPAMIAHSRYSLSPYEKVYYPGRRSIRRYVKVLDSLRKAKKAELEARTASGCFGIETNIVQE